MNFDTQILEQTVESFRKDTVRKIKSLQKEHGYQFSFFSEPKEDDDSDTDTDFSSGSES
jgi:hypothetical protein